LQENGRKGLSVRSSGAINCTLSKHRERERRSELNYKWSLNESEGRNQSFPRALGGNIRVEEELPSSRAEN
jgi:hypothetical protein